MIFNRFAQSTRAVVERAAEEARLAGARSIEAEHLLLALTSPAGGAACAALAGAGLDREDLEAALAEEEARTLALVGVDVGHFDVPLPRPPARAPRFGTSAKAALERTLRIAAGRGDRRLEPGHLLLALLDDGGGRVPRVLDVAGADVVALRDAAAASL